MSSKICYVLLLQLFAVLFFLMLYTLGIGSAVALSGAVITIICDRFPHIKYWIVALTTCIVGFIGGLVYVTPVSKSAVITYIGITNAIKI
jgi:solute carrier family 6 amino acid transporter-like protein 5/7/9/14